MGQTSYYLGDKIMADEMGEAWGRSEMQEGVGCGPEGKRLTGRHWHRWEDSIEINLKKQDGRFRVDSFGL